MAKVAQAANNATEFDPDTLELVADLGKHFWDDVAGRITSLVKTLVEKALEEKRTQVLQAVPYERTNRRAGVRGGSYRRRLKTKWGDVEIRIPRLAQGSYTVEFIDRYGRRQVDVDTVIGKLFLAGVSSRRLQNVADLLFGFGLSKSTVSQINKALDAEVRAYQARQISDTVKYLLLDGISAKVREVGVKGKVFLVAYGIHTDGRREILGFLLSDSESAPAWRDFLASLKARGLKGRDLKLVTVDGAPGLAKALHQIYPFAPVQRCVMHKVRNVINACRGKRNRAMLARSLRAVWASKTRQEALRNVKHIAAQWMVEEEKAVKVLMKDLHQCLTYLQLPENDHRKIRTTNALERAFREVRRRTRPMGSYVNSDSANRIMFGVTDWMNERWRGTPRLVKSAN